MQITGKQIFSGVSILSLIAFLGLLVWKIAFDGNISNKVLCIIAIIEAGILIMQFFLNKKCQI